MFAHDEVGSNVVKGYNPRPLFVLRFATEKPGSVKKSYLGFLRTTKYVLDRLALMVLFLSDRHHGSGIAFGFYKKEKTTMLLFNRKIAGGLPGFLSAARKQ